MSLLKVTDLHVYYGSIHAIKGVSFEVEENEIVTLIGANGAGKSTTLNTIAGLLNPRQGHIEFAGKDITTLKASRVISQGLALCPEGRRIFQQLTVRENLEMGGYTRPASELDTSLENVFTRFPRLKERQRQTCCYRPCLCMTSRNRYYRLNPIRITGASEVLRLPACQ